MVLLSIGRFPWQGSWWVSVGMVKCLWVCMSFWSITRVVGTTWLPPSPIGGTLLALLLLVPPGVGDLLPGVLSGTRASRPGLCAGGCTPWLWLGCLLHGPAWWGPPEGQVLWRTLGWLRISTLGPWESADRTGWPRFQWSAWALGSPCLSCNFKFVTSLFVAGLVRWTPSGNKYPSFTEPSCKWNDGSLLMNVAPSSSHNTLSPAFRVPMRSKTSGALLRGHMLETTTAVVIYLVQRIRSLYSASRSLASRCFELSSQSLPPTASTTRVSLLVVGNSRTFLRTSAILPPEMQIHWVFIHYDGNALSFNPGLQYLHLHGTMHTPEDNRWDTPPV